MQGKLRRFAIGIVAIQFAGCSVLTESGLTPEVMRASAEKVKVATQVSQNDLVIANPPARTLRFDGHEIVLGESESQSLEVDQLVTMIEPLIAQQRLQSAAAIILRHRETAERLLIERWATDADNPVVQLMADVLSWRSKVPDQSWQSLVEFASQHQSRSIQYQTLRNEFANLLRTEEPSNDAADQLLQASLKVNHPVVRIDALRLLGLRELVAGRYAWAESQFRQAIDVANTAGYRLATAELWLTVSEIGRRENQSAAAGQSWSNAVTMHLAAIQPDAPLDVTFWLLAEKTRPESLNWPAEISAELVGRTREIGCSLSHASSEMILWAALAQAQFDRGEFQSALVNFKRAETLVHGNNVMWLRIAQAKCLSGMGQAPAASAILSGPASHTDPSISAAATAAMGSIKIAAGAYQQGAQLLHKALADDQAVRWPSRNQAFADLAIAELILGDTDTGLAALHDAQSNFEKAGQYSLLIQSLDNELRLLEHEQRASQCTAVRSRLAELERL